MSALSWVQVGLNLVFWPSFILWFGSRRYRAGIERGVRMGAAMLVRHRFSVQVDNDAIPADRRPN